MKCGPPSLRKDADEMMSNRNVLVSRYTLFLTIFTVILVCLMIVNTLRQRDLLAKIISRQFGAPVLRRALPLIDGDAFERLVKIPDPENPYYKETCQKLYKLKQESQCLYLYTEAPIENVGWYFIADGSALPGETGFSKLGDADNADITGFVLSKLKNEVMKTQTILPGKLADNGIWGISIMCYAPIINSAGKSVGVIGCDFDAQDIYNEMRKELLQQILIVAMIFAAGLAVSLSLLKLVLKQYRQFNELNIKAQSASAAKSNFLAKTSHEIRTPMNAILGMAELLLRRDISPEAYEDVLSIKHAGQNLLAIINDILDFSKIESGKLEIIPANYQLTSLLNDVINIIRMRITEKAVRFVVNADSRLPNNLRGDVVRIRQVLLNLLSNAVKYTHAGHISLTVTGEMSEKNYIKLCFAVADTGIGIKPEDAKNIFGEFIQLDLEKNQGVEGTGLGLAIGKSLCKLMSGDITIESVYGKGSVFTAIIPQEIRNGEFVAYVPDAETKRTLLLEQRAVNMKSLSESLQNLGVPLTQSSDREFFFNELRSGVYSFAFAPLPAIKQMLEVIESLRLDTVPVLLAELGAVANANIVSVHMPAYALPLANVLNGITEIQDNGKPVVRFSAPDARVLVVDDITANLAVAKGLLAVYQVQVDTASNGPDAVALVKQNSYDIVFMDHMMPGMDGIESTRIIRDMGDTPEEKNALQKLPIIALTANAISGMKEMFLKNGFNDYLSKPIEIPKLDLLMDKWIPQFKKRKEAAQSKQREETRFITIEGVDTILGRAMTGGTETGYKLVLSAFVKDAAERMGLFAAPPGKDTLPLFTAAVHALKSASATIGARTVSEEAAALEADGKAGDIAAIERQLNVFRAHLSELTDNISKSLDAAEKESLAEKSAFLPEAVFLERIHELCKHIKDKNMKSVDEILTSFESETRTAKQQKIIDTISDYVLMSEYESAIQMLSSLYRQEQNGV
ncbi:MAG: hypothetical protein Pg6C_12030 [Treponemataceae bacterium]|nr:MAG: hypothetical protein Pg6C_12030 [Treponemataceae bacterium]